MDNRIRFVFLALAFLSVFACKSPVSKQKVPGIPQDLVLDTDANGNATLSWTAVTDADSYTIYYSADNSTYAEHASVTGTSRLVPFYGWYKVSAENEAGEGGQSSYVLHEKPTVDVVETPEFSVLAGNYDDAFSFTISCPTVGADIYYTTDGSTPLVGDPGYLYSGGDISVSSGDTLTVTAIAALAGYSNSDAARGVFHVRSWETLGSAGALGGAAHYVSIALDSAGAPCVAFVDASDSSKAKVRKYAEEAWTTVGGAAVSTSVAPWTSIAIDSADSIYVAYKDNSVSGKGTVRRFSGGSWSTLGGAGFTAGSCIRLSLAVHSSGSTHTPYLAYQDEGNGNKATVMSFTGSIWSSVGLAGFSSGAADYLSLALAAGVPYLAFQDVGNGYKATVMTFTGSSWVSVGSEGFSSGEAAYLSLALAAGVPYLAFQDDENGGKATVMTFNGSSWVSVGLAGFSSGEAAYLSLALAAGVPYLAYQDVGNGGKATVMTFDGSSWSTVGSAGFSSGEATYLSLALDEDGTPFVAYVDGGTSPAGKATVMKYEGGSWSVVGSAGFSAGVVLYTDLALDEDGNPVVAFQDGSVSGFGTAMTYK